MKYVYLKSMIEKYEYNVKTKDVIYGNIFQRFSSRKPFIAFSKRNVSPYEVIDKKVHYDDSHINIVVE